MDAETTRSPDLETLVILLGFGKEAEVRDRLKGMHPADIARLIENLDEELKPRLFALLDPEQASEVILELDDPSKRLILRALPSERLSEIVGEMDSDDATDVIGDLPADRAVTVLDRMEQEDVKEVQKLLRYEEDTAGGLMQIELVAVREDETAREAVEDIRAKGEEVGDLHNVFVVDRHQHLVGIMPLRKLILVPPETPVSAIMERDVVRIGVEVDQEEVAQIFKKHDLVSLPVVDAAGRLVGRITVDDVVDVMEEEASEDIYHLGGVHAEESVLSPPSWSVRMRLPWLLVNLATAMLAANVVNLFEGTIQALVVLAVFMPVVAGMGGNAAIQTITVIVRGIALGDLTFQNSRRVLGKEILVAVGNGVATGVITAVIAYFWKGLPVLGLVVGLAMIINIFVAGLMGTLIPLALRRLRFDPAVASGVIVTTFTDVTGFASFLGIATLLLGYMH